MAVRTPKSILTALVLWLVIVGGIAAVVRYMVLPRFQEKRRDALEGQTGSDGKYRAVVHLAADGFSGYCLLRAPDMTERLARQGIKLLVEDDKADYRKRLQRLADGDLDMAAFPVNSLIQCGAQLGDFPASIVYVIDETRGADAIVARKDAVAGISALNRPDARIVATPDSPSEFLARVMIANFSLPELPAKWMIAADGSADAYRRFRGDSGDKPLAYALWEPDVSRALKDKQVHVLLDSSKVKGYIVDVLVVRRQLLVDSYEVAKAVVESYARTAYAHRDDMVEVVLNDAREVGEKIERGDAEQMVKGIQWKNTLENYAHFGLDGAGSRLENIEDMIVKIKNVLVRTGAIESDPIGERANSLYFSRLVSELKSAGFHPGAEINIVEGAAPVGGGGEVVREDRKLARLSDAEWARLVKVGELRAEPISFGRGTARLTVQGRREAERLAEALKSWPQYYLTVTGRVRPSGDEQAALELARTRADAVVAVLKDRGVEDERIRALAEIGKSNDAEAQSVSFVVGQLPY